MLFWERQTTCDNRPFFVLEIELEKNDTLEEFREFVLTWMYKAMPKPSSRYFRIDLHRGDRDKLTTVVINGDGQIDCFLSGLAMGTMICHS